MQSMGCRQVDRQAADVEFIEKTALPDCGTYTMTLVQTGRKAPA